MSLTSYLNKFSPSLKDQEEPQKNDTLKSLISKNQELDKERVNNLAVLSEEHRKQLSEAIKYTNYYPDPITKDFQRQYILSDLEFTTEESKLAQSLTELNVRTDNLMNDAYTYRKTELEIEKLSLEKKFKLQEISEEEFKDETKKVDADLIDLEIANKQVSLRKIKLTSNNRFREAMAWKENVEDSLKRLNKESLDDVDLDLVRMELMRAKIRKWGELYAEGSFEMTPSKLQAIEAERKSFEAGIKDGLTKLESMLSPEQFSQRLKSLGLT